MSIYLNNLNNDIDVRHVSGGMIFNTSEHSLDVTCNKDPEGYKVNYFFSPDVYESIIYGSVKELTDNLSSYINDAFNTMKRKSVL